MDRVLSRLCRLNTCCLIADVEAGSAIIGYLDLISGGMQAVIALTGLIRLLEIDHRKTVHSSFMVQLGKVMVGITLILTVAKIAVSIILIIGVKRKSSRFLRLWLSTSAIFLITYLSGAAAKIVLFGLASIISDVILIVLQCYYTLVVNSYYAEMNDGNNLMEMI